MSAITNKLKNKNKPEVIQDVRTCEQTIKNTGRTVSGLGPTGATGSSIFVQGQTGVRGPLGPLGNTGPTGQTGTRGPVGLVGPKGTTGPTGPTGHTGIRGKIGFSGTKVGPTGPTGPGYQGETGPHGETGPDPTLQLSYNAGNIIKLVNPNPVIIQDGSPGVNPIFNITDNSGGTSYFNVTPLGTTINGKLTVTGLIDPTGLDLSQQVTKPQIGTAGKGTIWVGSSGGPTNIPLYTGNNNIDRRIIQNLAGVLGENNATGGNNIVLSGTDKIVGAPNITFCPGVGGKLIVPSDKHVTGNLSVGGSFTVNGTENASVVVSSRFLSLNQCSGSLVPTNGGVVITNQIIGLTDGVANNGFTAGIPGIVNPRVKTVSALLYVAGDIICICGSGENDGYYEVLSHSSFILTVKGIGLFPTIEDYTNTNFETTPGATGATGTINKVMLTVIKDNNGQFYIGRGSSTPLVFRKFILESDYQNKGDIIVGTGTGTTNLPVGSNKLFLTADSTQPTGLNWGAAVPIGSISVWAGNTGASFPTGYLVCDGQIVSNATYPALYAVIGTVYGIGNGSTGSFNVPNLKVRLPIGRDITASLPFSTLGATGGSLTSVITSTASMPSHTHTISDPGHGHVSNDLFKGGTVNYVFGSAVTLYADFTYNPYNYQANISGAGTGISVQSTGSSTPFNTYPPILTVYYIIRAL